MIDSKQKCATGLAENDSVATVVARWHNASRLSKEHLVSARNVCTARASTGPFLSMFCLDSAAAKSKVGTLRNIFSVVRVIPANRVGMADFFSIAQQKSL